MLRWETLSRELLKYYLSLTVVQGNGLRFNGTMEPARLIDQGSYFVTTPLLHYAGNNSSCPYPSSGKSTWLYPAQKKA